MSGSLKGRETRIYDPPLERAAPTYAIKRYQTEIISLQTKNLFDKKNFAIRMVEDSSEGELKKNNVECTPLLCRKARDLVGRIEEGRLFSSLARCWEVDSHS